MEFLYFLHLNSMMATYDLKKRTNDFAHRCINLSETLPKSQIGRHISGQLIRSSTSVAANYRATCLAQSKRTFIAKISIVIEEIDECEFWIRLILDRSIIPQNKLLQLLKEANELTKIFVASRVTARKSLRKGK